MDQNTPSAESGHTARAQHSGVQLIGPGAPVLHPIGDLGRGHGTDLMTTAFRSAE